MILNVPNRGAIQGMAPDEVGDPVLVTANALHPLAVKIDRALGLMQQVKAYERLTIEAAGRVDRRERSRHHAASLSRRCRKARLVLDDFCCATRGDVSTAPVGGAASIRRTGPCHVCPAASRNDVYDVLVADYLRPDLAPDCLAHELGREGRGFRLRAGSGWRLQHRRRPIAWGCVAWARIRHRRLQPGRVAAAAPSLDERVLSTTRPLRA
jgi:hypothetical protein